MREKLPQYESVDVQQETEGNEQREYTFEEGVEEIMRRIKDLLTSQDYVVVAFNSSGTNVGKTFLASSILKNCQMESILTLMSSNFEHIDCWIDSFKEEQKYFKRKGGVIVLEGAATQMAAPKNSLQRFKEDDNRALGEKAQEIGLPLKGVDLWVAIYSPNKPFIFSEGSPNEILGDIVIRNEEAKEHPSKSRP